MAEQAERDRRRHEPRIYVACLASYNNGILHGLWIDADQPVADLQADVTAMLASSPVPGAEEWAIHDYEGFHGFELHEYEALDVVSRVAEGIAQHGEAFSAYLGWAGASEEAVRQFRHHYIGTYESSEAWARSVAEDQDWERSLDEALDPTVRAHVSIDYAAFASSMAEQWHVVEGTDGVHVFAP